MRNSYIFSHLPLLCILIPMFSGALMLWLKEKRRPINKIIAIISTITLLWVSATLMQAVSGKFPESAPNNIYVYLLGNWEAPYVILLVVDRLSALMVLLSSILGLMCLIYATSLWDRAGVHFYPLFSFILMGVNGAFLTGDLFNLFVFFEIFLSASYGLLLHSSNQSRVTSGFQYIVVNLIGSFLLLIGISMIYSVTGTLNIADIALKAGEMTSDYRTLFEVACALLATAFLIKAAAWPLSFWLTNAYSSAVAPVAAFFSIMTKVGIYALLRVGSLLLPTGAPGAFGGQWLYFIGLGTLIYGSLGLLSEKKFSRMVSFCVIISSGTLLTALGMPGVALTGPSLYYLVSSVFAVATAFLLVEIISRTEDTPQNVLNTTLEAFGIDDSDNQSDYSGEVVGVSIPAALAFLGSAFIVCTLIIAGLPPFSGFIAKFALLSQAVSLTSIQSGSAPIYAWFLVGFMIFSGMVTVIVMSRTGIRVFWANKNLNSPKLSIREALPISILIGLCLYITIFVNDVMVYMNATAKSLDNPAEYVEAVFSKKPAKQSSGFYNSEGNPL
ncbi:monovalent cation/H+ antiporter subunit D [Taylorella equigenitalis]|uniref:monovalent cation/H+ antiporter subunit D n=1 Tax=Taylorella equigenitalis TaxID=29575 RepID=UPI000407922C|nr:monovalent cation/H+ antiporter subunit D [Taylorella equigenitalis]WDU48667.1 monovalent cation/H+ antiporter subunit D [Taylorella equigenitalis]